MGFKVYLKPTEFRWAFESSHHASLPKLLLQTQYNVFTSPSWGTWAPCHEDVENAETYQSVPKLHILFWLKKAKAF